MPVLYTIDTERRLLVYSGFGHCTGVELALAEQESRTDPRRNPGMRILLSLREVQEFDVALEDLQRGIEMNSQLEAAGWELEKTAVLVRNSMDGIMAELYDDLAKPAVQLRMATFEALQAALAWLGIPEEVKGVEGMLRELRSRFASSG